MRLKSALGRQCVLAILGGLLGMWMLAATPSLVSNAQDGNLLPNGNFEAGTTGWLKQSGPAEFSADAVGPTMAGSNAARVDTTGPGTILVLSQYWHTPIEPGATYAFEFYVDDTDGGVDVTHVYLAFRCNDGASFIKERALAPTTGAPFRHHTAAATAPHHCTTARVEITAQSFEAGARFSFDAASLLMTAPPPPPGTPDPVTPSPTATATSTVTATVTPTSTATASPTASPSPSPTALPITGTLWNADFAAGNEGWAAVAGDVSSGGGNLTLTARGTATAYLHQAVTVTPGGWYVAGATLSALSNVSAAWVRIAWYASTDASDAQLSVADSSTVTAGTHELTTGAVQAPPSARSARVRVLLRPAAPGAQLTIQQVTFAATSAPPPEPAPAASDTPSATAGPASSSQPAPPPTTSTPPPSTSPTPQATNPPAASGGGNPSSSHGPTAATSDPVDPDLAATQQWLRITEVLPNASQPGIDTEYEWVEITNLGSEPVSTEGMALHDNRQPTFLDAFTLAPGASLVVAASLAEVDGAPLVQRVSAIGNGLNNTGDRLTLVAADGSIVDALSYGSDLAFAEADPIPAPPPGHSIERRFDVDGVLVESVIREEPNPGFAEMLPRGGEQVELDSINDTEGDEDTDEPSAPGGLMAAAPRPEETSIWMLMLLVAGGVLGGAGLHRVMTIMRDRETAP